MGLLLRPDYVFQSVSDITPEFLRGEGIAALILDLDNTLTTHNNPVPREDISLWLDCMRAEGIRMLILSNNHYDRVKPFSESLGLDFVCDGGKPLGSGYKRCLKLLDMDKGNVASVGDQIYTDVLGSGLFGIRSIFTFPIAWETGFWFRVKRFLEKPFLPKKSRIIAKEASK